MWLHLHVCWSSRTLYRSGSWYDDKQCADSVASSQVYVCVQLSALHVHTRTFACTSPTSLHSLLLCAYTTWKKLNICVLSAAVSL